MSYKPEYNDQYLSDLATYVTSENNNPFEGITAPASSLLDTGASNIFTGTLNYGYNLTQQYYSQYGAEQDFSQAFKDTIKMYEKQAMYAKQDAEAIIQKGWEQQQIAAQIAAEQAKGTLAEQSTLGTGRQALGKSQIEGIAKRQSLDIDIAAQQTLLESWSNIDAQAVKLITSSAEEYNKFMTSVNTIEASMWQTWLEKHGQEYEGILTETIDGEVTSIFDYSTQWYDALIKIGAIDEESGTYTAFGKALASTMISDPDDVIGLKGVLEASGYLDFYYENSKFIRDDIFEIGTFDASAYYNDRAVAYEQSGYRLGDNLKNLTETEKTAEKDKHISVALEKYSIDFVGKMKAFRTNTEKASNLKKVTAEMVSANDINLTSELRTAITNNDISEGSLISSDGKLYMYAGDGIFIKSNAGNQNWGVMQKDKPIFKGGDVGIDISKVSNLDEYWKTNYADYKYVYTRNVGEIDYYVFSNIYYGNIGSTTTSINSSKYNKYTRVK